MVRRILRGPQVYGEKGCTGLSRTSIWRRERAGEFPKHVDLGPNSRGWFEDEIAAWLAELAAERDGQPVEHDREEHARERREPPP